MDLARYGEHQKSREESVAEYWSHVADVEAKRGPRGAEKPGRVFSREPEDETEEKYAARMGRRGDAQFVDREKELAKSTDRREISLLPDELRIRQSFLKLPPKEPIMFMGDDLPDLDNLDKFTVTPQDIISKARGWHIYGHGIIPIEKRVDDFKKAIFLENVFRNEGITDPYEHFKTS